MTHKIDPTKYNYTSDGKQVPDLVYDPNGDTDYPWFSKSLGESWTEGGAYTTSGYKRSHDLVVVNRKPQEDK